MTDVHNTEPPVVAVTDEGRHSAGEETLWNESWYCDVADPSQRWGAYLRLGLYPNRNQTWLHVTVAGRDRPLTFLADDRAPLVTGDELVQQTPQWTTRLETVSALKVWRVTARMTAEQFDDPRAVFRRERGTPVEVDVDLTWTSVAPPYHYGLTTRYEVSARVIGTIRIGDETIAVDAGGQRDHSWGVRDWWAFGWCWSAGTLEDGTAFHLSDIRFGTDSTGFGYVVTPDGRLTPAREISASEELDGDSVPVSAALAVEPGDLRMTLVPVSLSPILFDDGTGRVARMSRVLCRYETEDGRVGSGWTEWNFPWAPAHPA
ncbi:MAG: hypothetical protein ABSG81_02115 [Acidimicrobiales bacterium]|jgi:hypothetical protein